MSKENGVEALDRYIRRLSAHPKDHLESDNHQVAIKISDKNEKQKFSLKSMCCMCKSENHNDSNQVKRSYLCTSFLILKFNFRAISMLPRK